MASGKLYRITFKKKSGKTCFQGSFASWKLLKHFLLDVDECQITTHNCSDNATCINKEGSFNCSCKPGYRGNGYNCSGRCLQSFFSLKKKKIEKPGKTCFRGSFASWQLFQHFLSDVDECQISSHNCSDNATCINTGGSFNCSCKPGYRGNGYNCSGRCLQSFFSFKKNLTKRVFGVGLHLENSSNISFQT